MTPCTYLAKYLSNYLRTKVAIWISSRLLSDEGITPFHQDDTFTQRSPSRAQPAKNLAHLHTGQTCCSNKVTLPWNFPNLYARSRISADFPLQRRPPATRPRTLWSHVRCGTLATGRDVLPMRPHFCSPSYLPSSLCNTDTACMSIERTLCYRDSTIKVMNI